MTETKENDIDAIFNYMDPGKLKIEELSPGIGEMTKEDGQIVVVLYNFCIGEDSIESYKRGISEKYQYFLKKFIEKIIESQNAKLLINYYLDRAISLRKEIEVFQEKLYNNHASIGYHFEGLNSFMGLANEMGDDSIFSQKFFNQLDERYHPELSNYFTITYNCIDEMIAKISELLPSDTTTSSFTKLKINLSVGEIALLFSLLWNTKTVEAESKEELFRSISAFFTSTKSNDISVNSLRKKFQEHDDRTISDINALLTNLRTEFNKIK